MNKLVINNTEIELTDEDIEQLLYAIRAGETEGLSDVRTEIYDLIRNCFQEISKTRIASKISNVPLEEQGARVYWYTINVVNIYFNNDHHELKFNSEQELNRFLEQEFPNGIKRELKI